MSGKNKNYNKLIFLTTLSVYLGLVLVGGSPQVLAQQVEIISRQTKKFEEPFSFQNQNNENKCSELSFGNVIELLAKYNIQTKPVDFSYDVDFSVTPVKLRILKAEGNKIFINFLRKNTTCVINRINLVEAEELKGKFKGKFSGFPIRSFFPFLKTYFDYKVSNKGVFANVIYTFFNTEQAKNIASKIKQANSTQSSPTPLENLLVSSISNNTTIRYENNQVFIVTRLPRAGLDSLVR